MAAEDKIWSAVSVQSKPIAVRGHGGGRGALVNGGDQDDAKDNAGAQDAKHDGGVADNGEAEDAKDDGGDVDDGGDLNNRGAQDVAGDLNNGGAQDIAGDLNNRGAQDVAGGLNNGGAQDGGGDNSYSAMVKWYDVKNGKGTAVLDGTSEEIYLQWDEVTIYGPMPPEYERDEREERNPIIPPFNIHQGDWIRCEWVEVIDDTYLVGRELSQWDGKQSSPIELQ